MQKIPNAARLTPRVLLLKSDVENISPLKTSMFFTHWYGLRSVKYKEILEKVLFIYLSFFDYCCRIIWQKLSDW
jgi:hypothetical protein